MIDGIMVSEQGLTGGMKAVAERCCVHGGGDSELQQYECAAAQV